MLLEAGSLHGLHHGAGTALQEGRLYGLQAGLLHEDGPGQALCAEASCLHGHPLRTARRLRASSGERMLPDALLLQDSLPLPQVVLRKAVVLRLT